MSHGRNSCELLVIYVTHDAGCDIKATCTSLSKKKPLPVPRLYTLTSAQKISATIFSWEHFLKIHRAPSMARCYPSSPKRLKAFLLFRVWLRTFSPSLFKEQQQAPRVPWEHRGGRARWERGIRHAQQASRWEKENRAGGRQKDGEKEEEESAFERCFQLFF